MVIFPAIDLYDNKVVRLFKGDYKQMTVYSDDPVAIARDFARQGAEDIHVVDLAGAKAGKPMHLDVIRAIAKETGLRIETGGGVRDMQTIADYFEAGVARVILGTAAVKDENLLRSALERYGEKIAVGADIADGKIAVNGWLEQSGYDIDGFMQKMQTLGVKTVICTDVSKDGAMQGANHALYQRLQSRYDIRVIASGGVSSIADVVALKQAGVYGAIIGKAYYIGAVSLAEAVRVAK